MPVQIPTTLRRALGNEAALDFIPFVEKIIVERAIPRDEYREVLSRLDVLERDLTHVQVDVNHLRQEMREFHQEVNTRFDRVHERFDQMYQHFETLFDRQNRHAETRFDNINQRFDSINQRFDQINERMLVQTRWMVGTIALFGTLITVLLSISQYTP